MGMGDGNVFALFPSDESPKGPWDRRGQPPKVMPQYLYLFVLKLHENCEDNNIIYEDV
jgi:hypothetical protein